MVREGVTTDATGAVGETVDVDVDVVVAVMGFLSGRVTIGTASSRPRATTTRLRSSRAKLGRGACGVLGCARSSKGSRRRSEEHTSELQSLMRNPYAVFRLKKKK